MRHLLFLPLLIGCPPTKSGSDGDTGPADCEEATWYLDDDGDHFGLEETLACERPAGAVTQGGDCDDADPAVHPGLAEACNGVDDNCDGVIDEGLATSEWYADADGDGAYGGDPIAACAQPDLTSETADDCDDDDATRYPGAEETCNGVDDDCDGAVDGADDTFAGGSTYYRDADGDAFGDGETTTIACDLPPGYAYVNGDCDDTNDEIQPGHRDQCDGVDEDCDGGVDEDAAVSTYYLDADRDGFGTPDSTATACDTPAGYVSNAEDCDDSDRRVSPAGSEVCNGADDDCSGTADDSHVCDTGWDTGVARLDWVGSGTVTAGAWTSGTLGLSYVSMHTGSSVCEIVGDWYEDGAAPRRACPSCDWAFDLNTRNSLATGDFCADLGASDGMVDNLHYTWGFATTASYGGYTLENVLYFYYSGSWYPWSFNLPATGTYMVTGDQYAFDFEHPNYYSYYYYYP